jgi:hypothetical protein
MTRRTVIGETVLLNGGPCHGKYTDVPRPLPARVTIPPRVQREGGVILGPPVVYERMPCTYQTTHGSVIVWIYDWVDG